MMRGHDDSAVTSYVCNMGCRMLCGHCWYYTVALGCLHWNRARAFVYAIHQTVTSVLVAVNSCDVLTYVNRYSALLRRSDH